jgi:hypothetical protein
VACSRDSTVMVLNTSMGALPQRIRVDERKKRIKNQNGQLH